MYHLMYLSIYGTKFRYATSLRRLELLDQYHYSPPTDSSLCSHGIETDEARARVQACRSTSAVCILRIQTTSRIVQCACLVLRPRLPCKMWYRKRLQRRGGYSCNTCLPKSSRGQLSLTSPPVTTVTRIHHPPLVNLDCKPRSALATCNPETAMPPHSPLFLQRHFPILRFSPKLITTLPPSQSYQPSHPISPFHKTSHTSLSPNPPNSTTPTRSCSSTHRFLPSPYLLPLLLPLFRTPTVVKIANIRTIEQHLLQALINLIMHMTRPRRGRRARTDLRWIFD